MKKSLYFAAMAALAFTACTNGDDVTADVAGKGDVAVGFDAPYLSKTTRAEIVDNNNLPTLGFGVFAYEQGTTSWSTYRSSNVYPNFFYNQKVAWDGTEWAYSPVKYFSNNKGAKHSFFVYAPYQNSVNAVFSMAYDAPVIRYNAKDNYDLLWATPYKDLEKPEIDWRLYFNFQHALSKVSIDVVPFVDRVHAEDDHSETGVALAKGTTITVRSVKFVGKVPSQGLLNLGDGKWTLEATEEGAYEITSETKFEGNGTNVLTAKELIKDMMVIPTTEGVQIRVVYDVTTIDTDNPKNNSTVTNTITSEVEGGYTLAAGKSQTFHLHLGMTSVKFIAEATPWDTAPTNDKNVDLPNNSGTNPSSPAPTR